MSKSNSSIERISLAPAAWLDIARCARQRADAAVTFTGRQQFHVGTPVIGASFAGDLATCEMARAMAARAASL